LKIIKSVLKRSIGSNWKQVLYGTAWKVHNKSTNESVDSYIIEKMTEIDRWVELVSDDDMEELNDFLEPVLEAITDAWTDDDLNDLESNYDDKEHVNNIEEAVLSREARIKRQLVMRRNANKLKMARARAMSRHASVKVLERRAKTAARNQIKKVILNGRKYSSLSQVEKAQIEKRLDKLAPQIARLTKSFLRIKRREESERLQNRALEKSKDNFNKSNNDMASHVRNSISNEVQAKKDIDLDADKAAETVD
jgi:hypothetical protein